MSWFSKWGFDQKIPMDDVYKRLDELEERIKMLEDENIEIINELYSLGNSLDARIDILVEHCCRTNSDV